MIRLFLMTLLATCSLPAENVTFTVDTPRGPIEVQVMKSSSKRIFGDYHDLKMEGLVTNKTTMNLSMTELKPIYHLKNGTIDSDQGRLYSITLFHLAPGAAQEFKIWNPVSKFGFDDLTSIEWKANAEAAIGYIFRTQTVVRESNSFKATAQVDSKHIALVRVSRA